MHKNTVKILTGITFFAIMFTLITASDAISASWEVKITATLDTGARNRVTFGQEADGTVGYDPKYDVPAMSSGPIAAYFPHTDWTFSAVRYWRDVRASTLTSSWDLNVDSGQVGRTITLTWNSKDIDGRYGVTLKDNTSNEEINMNSQASYSFVNGGSRQFTISSEKLVTFLEVPSNLTGKYANGVIELNWTDNAVDEATFSLERRAGLRSEWRELSQLPADSSAYTDSAVDFDNNRSYYYRVKAVNGTTSSEFSNKVRVTERSSAARKTRRKHKQLK